MKKRDYVKVKGTYRLQLEEDGKIVGDSGWITNAVTNVGFNDYMCKLLGAETGSKQVSHVALGSGGAPNVTATALPSEVLEASKRVAVTKATSSTSKTIRFTATFQSSDDFISTTYNLSNIGLYNSATDGSLFAGNTYTSSACATNQNVNVTYDVTFA